MTEAKKEDEVFVVKDETYIPKLVKREIYAIQATYDGTANPDQQRLALNTIVTKFCLRYKTPYISGESQAGAFLSGRLHVGIAIEKALEIKHGLELDEG